MAEFKLKMTLICEAIAKICPIFGPSLDQILSQITSLKESLTFLI